MDYTVIQEHLNRLSDLMVAKGLRQPRAQFSVKSHESESLFVAWTPAKKTGLLDEKYQWFRDGTVGERLASAEAFIFSLPTADETKFREFMEALGGVIDLGKENGIEVAFLNPLRATMKKLSENALAYQPQAAE